MCPVVSQLARVAPLSAVSRLFGELELLMDRLSLLGPCGAGGKTEIHLIEYLDGPWRSIDRRRGRPLTRNLPTSDNCSRCFIHVFVFHLESLATTNKPFRWTGQTS